MEGDTPHDPQARRFVMIVCVDADLRDAIVDIINEFSAAECAGAASLADAAEQLQTERPVAVMIEASVPGDARGFLERARSTGAAVIVFSTRTPPELPFRTDDVGFLQVPFGMNTLLSVIQRAIEPRTAKRDA